MPESNLVVFFHLLASSNCSRVKKQLHQKVRVHTVGNTTQEFIQVHYYTVQEKLSSTRGVCSCDMHKECCKFNFALYSSNLEILIWCQHVHWHSLMVVLSIVIDLLVVKSFTGSLAISWACSYSKSMGPFSYT